MKRFTGDLVIACDETISMLDTVYVKLSNKKQDLKWKINVSY